MTFWTPNYVVSCKCCGATFPPETFAEDQFDRLMDRHDQRGFLHEMGLLSRTKALFDRHPEARRVIESIQRRSLDALLSDSEDEVEGGEGEAEEVSIDSSRIVSSSAGRRAIPS